MKLRDYPGLSGGSIVITRVFSRRENQIRASYYGRGQRGTLILLIIAGFEN